MDTYSVPDHIPPFLDEILSSLMGNSSLLDVCGDNVECLFDFNQTGDPNVGMAAMIVENQIATEMNDACKSCFVRTVFRIAFCSGLSL